MAQPAGSPQPNGSGPLGSPPPGRRSEPRAPKRLRLDSAFFSLAVGLAAILAILATATLNGLEIAGVSALPLTGQRNSVTDDSTANGDPATDTSAGSTDTVTAEVGANDHWAATDRNGRVRYDTTDTARIARAALDLLSYDWEAKLPAWRIEFVEGNDRVAGYTWSQEQRIEVFVRPNASSADLARILAHELGHAVDVTLNTGEERNAWLQQRAAADDTPWWPSSGAADFETGAGDFAECFAVLLVGPADYRSVVGPSPSDTDLALIAELAG